VREKREKREKRQEKTRERALLPLREARRRLNSTFFFSQSRAEEFENSLALGERARKRGFGERDAFFFSLPTSTLFLLLLMETKTPTLSVFPLEPQFSLSYVLAL